jgi:hypothetical protein
VVLQGSRAQQARELRNESSYHAMAASAAGRPGPTLTGTVFEGRRTTRHRSGPWPRWRTIGRGVGTKVPGKRQNSAGFCSIGCKGTLGTCLNVLLVSELRVVAILKEGLALSPKIDGFGLKRRTGEFNGEARPTCLGMEVRE